MQTKELIIQLLNELQEHKMAKDIFVPLLKKMGLQGVRFTGGDTEIGIDIEYFELSKPENNKNYVGIQFKKGNITYGAGGGKGTVKDVKNQAEEAFTKEIYDIDGKGTVHYIHRFIVATTGEINEPARQYIGRARVKGEDLLIDYWVGDRLSEYIQQFYMIEFEEYFKDKIQTVKKEPVVQSIVDEDYIEENYSELVRFTQKLYSTLGYYEKEIITALIELGGSSSMADLLFEIERNEESITTELNHLVSLDYIQIDDSGIDLYGKTIKAKELYDNINEELYDAEEDTDDTARIFGKVIK